MQVTGANRTDLKAALYRKGLTQTAVAARMGISRHYLCNLLAGRLTWTRRTARDFSMATGVSLAVVMGEREEAAV